MAAHVVTAINQILENPERELEHIDAALNLGSWTEDLDFEDYQYLSSVAEEGNHNNLRSWAIDMQEKYNEEWHELGMPETREEWRRAKYGY